MQQTLQIAFIPSFAGIPVLLSCNCF